jgi:hypothetical protein
MPVSQLSFLSYVSLIGMSSIVIGDRERCLQAGMDDHVTSKRFSVLIDDVSDD